LQQVLTFDFHNTLANCDPWFELEVRSLPWAVVQRLAPGVDGARRASIDHAYRELRLQVVASGNEIDAYDSVEQVLAGAGMTIRRQELVRQVDTLMRDAIESMSPVPGAIDTVRHLHASGLPLGIVSSAVHHQTLEWILARIGIVDCFDAIVTSASSGYYKSTPAIYHAALGTMDGDAATSVHVGDSLKWDVATAQQAGLRAVWLNTGRREVFATDPGEAVPALVLDTLHGAAPALIDLLATARTPIDA